ncbi:PIG-L family deacetylase [bacterium]|nr:PIG-L family deacetylase [bacterium]
MTLDFKNKVKGRRVGIYCAHPDDAELGVGGRMIQHIKQGDFVYIVSLGTGQTSHQSVLGIKENPSPEEVRRKRIEEAKRAAKVIGVNRIYLVNPPGTGRVRENKEFIKKKVLKITQKEMPDIVYYHWKEDAHSDHRVASRITEEVIRELKIKPKMYQFFIWTKETAKGRVEVKGEDVPEIPKEVIKVNIREELPLKREAIFQHRSQVSNWPYPEWQVQETPILDRRFLQNFFKEEEIFYERRW